MSIYIQNFKKFRPLLGELIARDIKTKYRKSVLGVLWTLLNPLFMMIILSVVFSNLFKFDVEYFPVYLLSGQLIFNFYSEATTASMSAIMDNGPLLKKIYVPKYLFVLSRVFSSTINLLASFTALILVMLAMRVELHYTVLLVPIPLIFIVLFSLGVGLILSAITVKFRDIMHLYSVFVTALMYLTPVIYPMSILPAWLTPIVKLNPITNILQMFRNVMIYNSLPSIASMIIAFVECSILLVFGLYVFYKYLDDFILYIRRESMENQEVIRVDHVSMRFSLASERVDNFKEYVIKTIKRQLSYGEFWALKDVSFSINRGDALGLIGLNGSGKSTMLKVIAGVLKPTKGSVSVNGTVAPLIELGAGFDMNLTAEENVFLNGALIGYSRQMMEQYYDDIVEFSELHDFMNVPVKNFSSGMVSRLGFSIATIGTPDILIVDEVLSVGDFRFQEKCQNRIKRMLDAGTTLLFVSHSIQQVEELCNKVVWLDKGVVKMFGESKNIAEIYSAS